MTVAEAQWERWVESGAESGGVDPGVVPLGPAPIIGNDEGFYLFGLTGQMGLGLQFSPALDRPLAGRSGSYFFTTSRKDGRSYMLMTGSKLDCVAKPSDLDKEPKKAKRVKTEASEAESTASTHETRRSKASTARKEQSASFAKTNGGWNDPDRLMKVEGGDWGGGHLET